MLCLCLCFVCFCLCLCFECICLCFVFSCYMCVGYAGRADAVWAGAEWGHYAKCPFSYPPLYPPLSFLDYLQFKLEHSSQIFLDTIKSSHPPITHDFCTQVLRQGFQSIIFYWEWDKKAFQAGKAVLVLVLVAVEMSDDTLQT